MKIAFTKVIQKNEINKNDKILISVCSECWSLICEDLWKAGEIIAGLLLYAGRFAAM